LLNPQSTLSEKLHARKVKQARLKISDLHVAAMIQKNQEYISVNKLRGA
jgi:hypothetical protein